MLVFAVVESAFCGGMVALTFDYDPDREHKIFGIEAIDFQLVLCTLLHMI